MKALERPFVVALLLVLATAVLLHGNLTAPFSRLDDHRLMCFAVQGPWTKLFRTHPSRFFAPLADLSYRLDRVLFGPAAEEVQYSFGRTGADRRFPSSREWVPAPVRPWAYGPRLTNGLYHLLAGFFLWLFLSRLGAGAATAAFVALAWAVHPLALESVAWVSERRNTLCAMFGFASLAAWTVRPARPWRLPLVWLLFAAALLSKVSALSFVPLFAALEFSAPGGEKFAWRDGRQWAGALERLSGQLVLAVLAAWTMMSLFEHEIAAPPGGNAWTGLLTDSSIFWRYTRNLLLPLDLSFFYGVEPVCSLSDPRLWLCGGTLALLWGALFWLAGPPLTLPSPQRGEGGVRGRWLVLLGFVWFFGGLGPNANLVATAFPMQDRYLYLPSPGLLLALGVALRGLAERTAAVSRALPLGGAAYLVLLAALCAVRSDLFGDSKELEIDAARLQPSCAMAQLCAANAWRDKYWEHARRGEQLPGGSLQWQQEVAGAEDCAAKALAHFGAAERCTGFQEHVDYFTLRLWQAEILVALGRYDEACVSLGPLPPPGLPMRPEPEDSDEPDASDWEAHLPGYPQRTLAGAWLIRAETSLRRCGVPGITTAQKMALAEEARQEAEESLKVHKLDDEARVLWARAQIVISDQYLARKDLATALKLYNEAVAKLKEVPPGSLSAYSAQRILDNIPPPGTVQSEPRP